MFALFRDPELSSAAFKRSRDRKLVVNFMACAEVSEDFSGLLQDPFAVSATLASGVTHHPAVHHRRFPAPPLWWPRPRKLM